MNYKLSFSPKADKDIASHKKANPTAYKKITRLLLELTQHPREGTGHPEPLKGGNGILWSRKINDKDRIVYEIYDDTVIVLVASAKGHYNDK